jgi:hypothetical protein
MTVCCRVHAVPSLTQYSHKKSQLWWATCCLNIIPFIILSFIFWNKGIIFGRIAWYYSFTCFGGKLQFQKFTLLWTPRRISLLNWFFIVRCYLCEFCMRLQYKYSYTFWGCTWNLTGMYLRVSLQDLIFPYFTFRVLCGGLIFWDQWFHNLLKHIQISLCSVSN